ncbi:MAG: hypothetical protein Dbin4_02848 [Alphaproteobacteria bacterium]|nr:hypothetical protein [Alphaproteobacteria bacterium]
MRKYQVIEKHIEIGSGKVLLDPDQYKTRAHNLSKPDADGTCAILKPIQFKFGEMFGYDGDFGKHLSQFVIELGAPKPDKKAALK